MIREIVTAMSLGTIATSMFLLSLFLFASSGHKTRRERIFGLIFLMVTLVMCGLSGFGISMLLKGV